MKRTLLWAGFAGLLPLVASAQLFSNLEALSNRVKVGNPRQEADAFLNENPKSLVAADLDGDGKADWAVSRLDGKIVIAWGLGDGTFLPPQEYPSPAGEFRQLIAADLNGDNRIDLAAAEPYQGLVYLFFNQGNRQFSKPSSLATWEGARNLVAGEFTGDGIPDIAVAGPERDPRYDPLKPWTPPVVTPLPRSTKGIALYRGLGGGAFAPGQALTNVDPFTFVNPYVFPRPVYVLRTWRDPGKNRDRLLLTHAQASHVWILDADDEGALTVNASLVSREIPGVRDFVIGPLGDAKRDPSGLRVLVVANRDGGKVIVSPIDDVLAKNGATDITNRASHRLDVPGGPRSLELADVDGDGWNDLVVVARYLDRVITFRNNGAGGFERASEAVTGRSPRDLACADFDGDKRIDFVALNRESASVSVLLAAPPGSLRAGFAALDQMYPVDGDVAQIGLKDINGDSRDDVLQLHRSSAEVSVRLSGPGGRLSEPTFYPMGPNPASLSMGDLNGDGLLDVAVANMGDNLGGRVTARMGDGRGAFGPAKEFYPPEDPPANLAPTGGGPDVGLPAGARGANQFGRLYAVLQTDLDGDGKTDLAAGYYDCRIIFYRGDGSGGFTPTPGFSDHELFFITGYEARFIVAGDFDQDGDNDLALAAWPGDVVVLENTGNFFLKDTSRPPYKRHFFPRHDNKMAKARDIIVDDVNGDKDPDLVVGTGAGTQILLGRPGMAFERRLFATPGADRPSLPVAPNIQFPVSALTEGDFDGDGDKDLAAICESDGCLRILTKGADGLYDIALIVEAPRTTYLATGDVDGDGKTDLVGTGATLWVALSGRRTSAAPPMLPPDKRERLAKVVINEVLANNDNVPVRIPEAAADAVVNADAMELYNGGGTAASLDGWSVEVTDQDGKSVFNLPKGRTLPPGGRQMILFSKNVTRGPWATGFPLPKEGAEIVLLSPAGEADRVSYPILASNQSYTRFTDAATTWRINHLPDPGQPNADNGAVDPVASLHGVSLQAWRDGGPIRFYAKAKDDVGVIGLIIHYRPRGLGSQPFRRALLYDDGMNGDGGRLDGVFSGVVEEALPPGVEIEFYLEAEDLSGRQVFLPDAPPENGEESSGSFFTLTVPRQDAPSSGLEISEVATGDVSSLTNEKGKRVDWVELRNTSQQSISLAGLELVDGLFDGSPRLLFPKDVVIPPGGYRIVFCDDKASTPTALHAPFKLNADRVEDVYLVERTSLGSQSILDFVQSPRKRPGLSCAKVGVGSGRFFCLPPTPGGPNVPHDTLLPLHDPAMGFTIAYGTRLGLTTKIETSPTLAPGSWLGLQVPVGDGFEGLLNVPMDRPATYFRIRK